MFASNALPPPTTFAQEHPSLRRASETARPQPQGECHYESLNRTSSKCLCRTYQHNRSLPGNACDCGHSACYHSPNSSNRALSPDRIVAALVEKVKKLEDVVIQERQARNNVASKERQAWEKEVRVLREALAPFYRSESEMKARLAQLENKIEYSFDEQARIKERVTSMDHTRTHLERQLDRHGTTRDRKRKVSVGYEAAGVLSPESNYIYSSSSAASDTMSNSTQRSPQPPSPVNLPPPMNGIAASPRSSGLLNLKPLVRPSRHQPSIQTGILPVDDEPRSSGFLSIDLADRLRRHRLKSQSPEKITFMHEPPKTTHLKGVTRTAHGLPSPPLSKASTGAIPVSQLLTTVVNGNSDRPAMKRHKQHGSGMLALEILANATVDHPIA